MMMMMMNIQQHTRESILNVDELNSKRKLMAKVQTPLIYFDLLWISCTGSCIWQQANKSSTSCTTASCYTYPHQVVQQIKVMEFGLKDASNHVCKW